MGIAGEAVDVGGRPRIDDHLEVVLYVEAGRRMGRAKKLSVRAFSELRSTSYLGRAVLERGPGGRYTVVAERRSGLRREALRRRYRKARMALGLKEPLSDADGVVNPAAELAQETIDRMVQDFL